MAGLIEEISNLGDRIGVNNYIWIYNWNPKTLQFYCIPRKKNLEDGDPSPPLVVNLSNNFKRKYNHLVIATKNRKFFEKRILGLNKRVFFDIRLQYAEDGGHLIMRELTAEQIV